MGDRFFSPTMRKLGGIECPNLNKELENVNMDLFTEVQKWLRMHGKVGTPLLPHGKHAHSEQQQQTLRAFAT